MDKKLPDSEINGCPYCSENKSLFWCDDSNEHAIREVYIESDGTLTVETNITDIAETENYKKWGINLTQKDSCNFPINYCCMCGRKLKGDSNE